jgi:hypothetical protein
MVELAVLLPVLIMLFLGGWTAAALAGDNDTALQATQAGARFAAELGGQTPASVSGACSATSDPGTCTVDEEIIQEMIPIFTTNMPNAVVNEVDIYQPSGSGSGCSFTTGCPPDNGAYTAGELIDSYPIDGTSIDTPTSLQYLLSDRSQIHPDEAELGVRLLFTYTSPTWSLFNVAIDAQYSVVRLAPEA